jgi:hypothetical protein
MSSILLRQQVRDDPDVDNLLIMLDFEVDEIWSLLENCNLPAETILSITEVFADAASRASRWQRR